MKYIIFGGFDYAVYYEMNADALLQGIDYFVDNTPALIGATYLGKPVKAPAALLHEDKNKILIFIGSIVYHTEIAFQLKDMGFEEGRHFVWGIEWMGDEKCPRLWRHLEWKDQSNEGVKAVEESEIHYARMQLMTRFIDPCIIKTVVDWGSANERLRSALPSSIAYIGVDYTQYTPETIVFDINQADKPIKERLPRFEAENACAFMGSFLPYVHDWKHFLDEIARLFHHVIIGQNDFTRVGREKRRTGYTYNNALFTTDIILYMNRLGYRLENAVDFRLRSTILHFAKSAAEE